MLSPFVFNYDSSLSGQQIQWIKDSLARCRFALDRGGAEITFVVVAEPTCEGHKDYMCTHGAPGTPWTVEIRQGADDPTSPSVSHLPNPARDVKNFFMEGIAHEVIGHVFFFEHFSSDAQRAQIAAMFARRGATGAPGRTGTLDDWNPTDLPWEDRIQEALAEFAKDVYLPPEARVYDNRTNWDMQQANFSQWIDLVESVICPPDGGDDS